MADPLQIALASGSAVVADGTSSAVDIGELHTLLRGSVSVTAMSGLAAGELATFSIETSPDGSSAWRPVITFEFRSPRVEEFTVDELQRWCRLSWVLNGATVTFTSNAESHTLYATRRDLRNKSLPDVVTEGQDRDVIAECLLSATADAEDAMRIQYPGALQSWPDSLRQRCANIARYRIFNQIGFQPTGIDELIVKDHDDAQIWLRAVAARRIVLAAVSAPAKVEPARVSFSRDCSDPPRRFSDDWGDY